VASGNQQNLTVGAFHPGRGFGVRATWSRAISTRADVKLAPCKARPNLFSGD
jgi:hypothetical protein